MIKSETNSNVGNISVAIGASSKRHWKKVDVCVVIGGPWANCRFYSAWLRAIADLQETWTEVCKDDRFGGAAEKLNVYPAPNFERAAWTFIMRLKRELTSAVVELDMENIVEFCIMCVLGVFELKGDYYEMAIPASISRLDIKQAALTVATLLRHLDHHPSRVLVTVPRQQAVALQ